MEVKMNGREIEKGGGDVSHAPAKHTQIKPRHIGLHTIFIFQPDKNPSSQICQHQNGNYFLSRNHLLK